MSAPAALAILALATTAALAGSPRATSSDDCDYSEVDYSCFRNEIEAASIGSLLFANLWRDAQATGCDQDLLADVYNKYTSEDITYIINGVEIFTNQEGLKAVLIDGGAIAIQCEHAILSFAVDSVEIIEEGKSFLWVQNDIFVTTNQDAIAFIPDGQGRENTIELDENCNAIFTKITFTDTIDIDSVGALETVALSTDTDA